MVEAAFFCFCNKGIEATSIIDIAREAEVGEATVYRYFSNKENLALECGKRFWFMACDFMEVWIYGSEYAVRNGMEQLEGLVRGAFGFYQEYRQAFRMLHNLDTYLLSHHVTAEQLGEYFQAADGLRPVLCNAIEKGKSDGSISSNMNTGDVYEAVTTGVLSLMEKTAVAGALLTPDRTAELDRKLLLFLEILIAGLKVSYGTGDKNKGGTGAGERRSRNCGL